MSDVIICEKSGFIATVTLNRPEKRNSLNPEMLLKMAGLFRDLSQTDDIRTVVIKGAGDKAFSAGYDLTEIPTDVPPDLLQELKGKNPLEIGLDAVENYPYPVIAMIDGFALGGGCELAVTCDLRIASDTSKMGIPPSRLGVVYSPKGIQKFINVVGLQNAKELFYTGRYYDIARAMEMGLVNYVIPKGELESFTYNLAEEISGNAPLSLKGQKRIFQKLLHYQTISEAERPEIEKMIVAAFNSDDLKEGMTAFFQKRKPNFNGS
jgi:enoyl-CoA hydratase/carnithine racemase